MGHEGPGHLDDVDLRVERPRDTLNRHQRLHQQPVADRDLDAVAAEKGEKTDAEIPYVGPGGTAVRRRRGRSAPQTPGLPVARACGP